MTEACYSYYFTFWKVLKTQQEKYKKVDHENSTKFMLTGLPLMWMNLTILKNLTEPVCFYWPVTMAFPCQQ